MKEIRRLVRSQVEEAEAAGDTQRATAARVQLESVEAAHALRKRWTAQWKTEKKAWDAA